METNGACLIGGSTSPAPYPLLLRPPSPPFRPDNRDSATCPFDCLHLRHGDGGRAAALVALSGDDLVVVRTELEAGLGPGVEVSANIDGARGTVVLADGPELVKGAGALNGRLVDAPGLGDGVGAAVLGDAAELAGLRRGVVVAEGLDDVVLDQGVLGPPVDGQVAVTLGAKGTREVDGAGRTGIPGRGTDASATSP